jgi:hypothetical protein
MAGRIMNPRKATAYFKMLDDWSDQPAIDPSFQDKHEKVRM